MDTCYSLEYTYSATAHNKCGSMTLTSNYIDARCAKQPKKLHETYDCFVLDCNDKEFSFSEFSTSTSLGTVVVVICCIPLIVSVLLLCYCWICCRRQVLCQDVLGCNHYEQK